jgi:hypothetical protein
MSIAQQFAEASATARTLAQIDNIGGMLWKAHAEAHLSDADAQAVAEALQARKQALRNHPPARPMKRASARRVVSPDRAASIRRRRAVAMSGAVPAKLAAHFTLGELAALSIVAGEVKRNGRCELCMDAIAGMAGVCRSTAQNALRAARLAGLVTVTERPRPGRKNLPNIIRVVSPEWRAWLRLGSDRVQKVERHGNQVENRSGDGLAVDMARQPAPRWGAWREKMA